MDAYLAGEREELRVITTVDGVRQDFFNEQDRFHMEEVQGLFLGGSGFGKARRSFWSYAFCV